MFERHPQHKATRTGIATATDGGVAISGVNTGDIKVYSGPVARSDYTTQVRRIAPVQLLGREQELAELATFSTSPRGKPYSWWRASAWAGKSALMSWFVLEPPSGVRVVSFFITARLAGQSDRIAFVDVVLEQLLELLGEPMPTSLTDATRDSHLLGALTRAARSCEQSGERLVLVVDGLDEDQGVTAGPDAHSIAALLPADPPAGMRIVIAGRPHPPIPGDVPDDHPLRDPDIVRFLAVSPHAEVVRQDAERELKRLLRGSEAEQDLLGLLTAGGGGLSGADLTELTGFSAWEIRDHLSAVSGRTFLPRAGRWRPDTVVYVLGHEELQQQAIEFIGPARRDRYRQRLQAWADGYRDLGWPDSTPEYLLRGYFRLLQVTGDLSRMLACATDSERHNRMLDITGGDTVALSEITAAQEAVIREQSPDLVAMCRLAVHRAKLTQRNDHIPAQLPGLWVQLGRSGRAEALARSITDPVRQVQAVASVAREVAACGDPRQAATISQHAQRAVNGVVGRFHRAIALTSVARAEAAVGNLDQARLLINRAELQVDAIDSDADRGHALAAIARAMAAAGDLAAAERLALSIPGWSERADAQSGVAQEAAARNPVHGEAIARSVTSRSQRALALAAVARSLAAAGASRRAQVIAGRAVKDARSIRNISRQAWTLAIVAEAVASAGNVTRAASIARQAERLARLITKPSERDKTLIAVARAMAVACGMYEAELISNGITGAPLRAKALSNIASGLLTCGYRHQAEVVAGQAEKIARSVADQAGHGKALTTLARAVAVAGDIDRAGLVAGTVLNHEERESAFTVLVQVAADKGELGKAAAIADSIAGEDQRKKAQRAIERAEARLRNKKRAAQGGDVTPEVKGGAAVVYPHLRAGDLRAAEAAARSIVAPFPQAQAVSAVAQALVHTGDPDRAEAIVCEIANPILRVQALAAVAQGISSTSTADQVARFIDRAEVVTCSISEASKRDQALNIVVEVLDNVGETGRAEEMAKVITNGSLRSKALAHVTHAIAASGDLDRAMIVVGSIADSSRTAKAIADIVCSGVNADNIDRAMAIARSIIEPGQQALALTAIARTAAKAGEVNRAERIAGLIASPALQAQALTAVAAAVNPHDARHAIARALQVGGWQIPLDVLIRIEPSVVDPLADEELRILENSRLQPVTGA